jgi:hypothetical protein
VSAVPEPVEAVAGERSRAALHRAVRLGQDAPEAVLRDRASLLAPSPCRVQTLAEAERAPGALVRVSPPSTLRSLS